MRNFYGVATLYGEEITNLVAGTQPPQEHQIHRKFESKSFPVVGQEPELTPVDIKFTYQCEEMLRVRHLFETLAFEEGTLVCYHDRVENFTVVEEFPEKVETPKPVKVSPQDAHMAAQAALAQRVMKHKQIMLEETAKRAQEEEKRLQARSTKREGPPSRMRKGVE